MFSDSNSLWPQDPRKRNVEPPPKNFGERLQRVGKAILTWIVILGAMSIIGRVIDSPDEKEVPDYRSPAPDSSEPDYFNLYISALADKANAETASLEAEKYYPDEYYLEAEPNYSKPDPFAPDPYSSRSNSSSSNSSNTNYFGDEWGCPDGCTYHKDGCDIKGNISYHSGEKIYHLPGQEFYNATEINSDYGELWFCTEEEARSNGWRKSSN